MIVVLCEEQSAQVALLAADLDIPPAEAVKYLLSGPLAAMWSPDPVTGTAG